VPDREAYRRAAAECLKTAETTTDLRARDQLTLLAADFLELAIDSGQDKLLRVLIDEFNDTQVLPRR
jgi:hypothetical protein